MTADAIDAARARAAGLPAVAGPPIQAGLDGGLPVLSARWVAAEDWPGLAEPWARLAEAAAPNVFLAPAFALAARGLDPAPGLGALVLARGDQLAGFVPGRFRLAGRLFSLWTHPYAPYGCPLLAPGAEADGLAALFAFLRARGAAALHWPLLDEGPLSAALDRAAAGHRAVVLDRHCRAALLGKAPQPAKEPRRLMRRLAEAGSLAHLSTAEGLAVAEAVDAFLALEEAGWKGRKGTAIAACLRTRRFFEQAVTGLAGRGDARIDLMTLDRRPVAAAVTLRAGSRAWYWKTAYDEGLAKYSPGTLLSLRLGEALTADPSITLVDSCAMPGHSMIDRIWPDRLAITSRLLAVRAGGAGAGFHAALAVLTAKERARAAAKALLARLRRARAGAGG